jgi:hypothetical protein
LQNTSLNIAEKSLVAEVFCFSKAFSCHFFLDKEVTKKSRAKDIQPVRSAAILIHCTLVACTFDHYSLRQTVYLIETAFYE